MSKETVFSDSVELLDVREKPFKVGFPAALWVFHDPHPSPLKPKAVRATTGALLRESGVLTLATSICSEGDNFSRRIGRERVLQELALTAPNAKLHLEGLTPFQINNDVELAVLAFQMEAFRELARKRGERVEKLEKRLRRVSELWR